MISSCRELFAFTIGVILFVLLCSYFLVKTLTFPPSHNQLFAIGAGIVLGVLFSLYLHHCNKTKHLPEVTNLRPFSIAALIGVIIGTRIVDALLTPEQEEFMIIAVVLAFIIALTYAIPLQWRRWL